MLRFVRMAARAARTPAAVIVSGSQAASLGARTDVAALIDILLGDPDGLTVLPGKSDIDEVWSGFAAHVPLRDRDGGRIGFLCVLDPAPRDTFGLDTEAALLDVAALLESAAEHERRRVELTQATRSAAREDGLLRLVTEVGSCVEALTHLLNDVSRYHGAAVGRIWRLELPQGDMHEISRFDDGGFDQASYDRMEPTAPVRAGNSMTAEAIELNEPRTFTYSTIPSQERFVLLAAAVAAGLRSQVSFPIWLHDQRFGMTLAFRTERADLEAVVADLGALVNAVRPALLRREAEDRMRFMAHHDALTQLANRNAFDTALRTAMEGSGSPDLALLCMDLDGFKLINDTRGHSAGDKLLVAVAERLRSVAGEGDLVARTGGDEFAVIQQQGVQPHAATQLARQLLGVLEAPFDIDGRPAAIGASIGIALFPSDGRTVEELQRNADAALLEAKRSRRNTFQLFERNLGLVRHRRTTAEGELREAIGRDELSLAFQPVFATRSLRVCGVEALLRWTHPTRGPVAPARLVAMAEESGLIVPIGQWALEAACAEAVEWDRPVRLSVNVSLMQFRQPGLAKHIAVALGRTGLPAARLDLEVSEGVLMDESSEVLRTMHEVRELGVSITLDDFGMAHASLGKLRRFPFKRIKIDRSLIQSMGDDDGTLAIVQAIISLSARLGFDVVAEGVEEPQQLEMLQDLGCGLVQGYLLGQPVAGPIARVLVRAPEWSSGASKVGAGIGNGWPAASHAAWLATMR